jgi:hypothetical protein
VRGRGRALEMIRRSPKGKEEEGLSRWGDSVRREKIMQSFCDEEMQAEERGRGSPLEFGV